MATRSFLDTLIGFGVAAGVVVFFGACVVTGSDPGKIFSWAINWLVVAPLLMALMAAVLAIVCALVVRLFTRSGSSGR